MRRMGGVSAVYLNRVMSVKKPSIVSQSDGMSMSNRCDVLMKAGVN